MKKFFKNLASDELGQSTTEYILMLAVVVMIAMKFKKSFSTSLDSLTSGIGNSLNSESAALQQ